MTSNPWRGWGAQTPSPDFAARAVAQILRDKNERPNVLALSAVSRTSRLTSGARRWVTFAAAAVVLMAGGAWAWTALPRALQPPPAAPRPVAAMPPAPPRVPATTIKPPDPIPEVTYKPPTPSVVLPPRRKEVPSAASLPDAGRRVIVPPCDCHDVLCACLSPD